MYRISGTKKIPKGKAATYGYKTYEADTLSEMSNYMNTHAVIPCVVEGGHRLRNNVVEILPWIRLDVDVKGEAKKIDKALKKVEYIKKPSTNNDKHPYKWHYFIPVDNVSQNYDEYKLQYFKFLAEHKIELHDKSLASVVQNTNPYKGDVKDADAKTTHNIGRRWVAPKVKAPKKIERKEKQSDIPKDEIKKMLSRVDPDCSYAEWLQVGFALYDWCPKKGLKMFDKWSKKSDKYDGTTEDKWDDFSKNASGEVSIGTLVHMAMGEKQPEVDELFKSEVGSVKPKKSLTKKEKKKLKKEKEKKKAEFSLLDIEGVMNDEELARQANEVSLSEGLLAEGYHTILYGESGSNKTTVSAWAVTETLKEFPNKICQFWAFDSDRIHNNAIYEYTKEQEVVDRLLFITGKNSDYFKEYYDEARELEQDLSDLIIVIDTYKFVTADVNNKNANKTVLHEIKKLQTLGATILTLAHSNKDGVKFSGTAELSQDSDGMLLIKREKDETTGDITTTIKPDGRVRFGVPSGGITLMSNGNGVVGMQYHKKILDSLTRIENKFDSTANEDIFDEVEKKKKDLDVKQRLNEVADKKYLDLLVDIIKHLKKKKHIKPLKSTIKAEAKSEGMPDRKIDSLLLEYTGIYWTSERYTRKGGGTETRLYKLIKRKD